jgi:hypothetical protein
MYYSDRQCSDFELRTAKQFPLVKTILESKNSINIGKVTDGKRKIDNMPFGLNMTDLNSILLCVALLEVEKLLQLRRFLWKLKNRLW